MVVKKSGIAVGKHHGHVTAVRAKAVRPVSKKGKGGKRTKVVREIAREVCGLAPYERRLMEILKVGRDKKALKFAKRRLGTHRRAKKKREELSTLLFEQRAAAARKHDADAKAKKDAEKK